MTLALAPAELDKLPALRRERARIVFAGIRGRRGPVTLDDTRYRFWADAGLSRANVDRAIEDLAEAGLITFRASLGGVVAEIQP
jgi:hypothetical protein